MNGMNHMTVDIYFRSKYMLAPAVLARNSTKRYGLPNSDG
jgi:hypothetical protein